MNKIVIAIIAFAMWTGSVFLYGNKHGKSTLANAVNVATQNAFKKARKQEQEKQGKINEFLKKQYNEVSNINATLNDDIIKLHKRERRRDKLNSAKLNCAGATGQELSRPDAEFLTREAARADRIRLGLKTCYKYADEVIKKGEQ